MADPTVQLDPQGDVNRLRVTTPDVEHHLVLLGEDDEEIEEVSS